MSAATAHLSAETLLGYWLRETDAATTETIDEHLLRCDACGANLDGLIALAQGVRDVFRAGGVGTIVVGAFIARLRAQGLRMREYQLAHNGSVHCTVAPHDELLAARLVAPLQGVQRLDAVATLSFAPGIEQRLDDIPFDAAAGEIVYLPKLAEVRVHPRHDATLTLLAHTPDGARQLGRYTFHHHPWPAA